MAIYHLEAKVITRGVGRSVAAAAYASCSEIYNDYDGVTHDYDNTFIEIIMSNYNSVKNLLKQKVAEKSCNQSKKCLALYIYSSIIDDDKMLLLQNST